MQLGTRLHARRLLGIGPFRWSDAAPWRAARVAFGVVIPLTVGWAAGHIDYGAYAALGALPAGIASFQGETLSRAMVVVVASIGMALSTFVGATAAVTPWLLVPFVAIWGYFTGLTVCLEQRSSTAILQWSVALLIAAGLPFEPAQAALRAALVLAGGLLQAALVAGSWTVRPGGRERTALAEAYQSLATYASELSEGRSAPPPTTAFSAEAALEDPNPLLPGSARLMFIDLLEEAQRIRAGLAALAAQAAKGTTEQIRRVAADAAATLNLIGRCLTAERAERAALERDLGRKTAELTVPIDASWRWAGEALLGQLRAVCRIVVDSKARSAQGAEEGAGAFRSVKIPGQRGVGAAIATLRANVTTTSEAGRHALRLAVIAALAEVMAQATGLNQGRWVALTILLVLKPDYTSTLYRGVQRAAGTMLGAGFGGAAVGLAQASQGWLVAAAGVCIAVAYALFEVSYLIFSAFIATFVVILLELFGIPAISTAEARLLDTFIGAAMALIAYFAWPTWEGATTQQRFARLLESQSEYAKALLREVAQPGSYPSVQLRMLQATARRARSDAEAATVRLLDEPVHTPLTPEVAQSLLAAVARFAHAALALHALTLPQDRPTDRTSLPEYVARQVNALCAAFSTTMERLATALRALQSPQPIPALRPIHVALRAEAALTHPALVAVTDLLVDSANTVDAILRHHLPSRQPEPK